jgi:hypothetical protein
MWERTSKPTTYEIVASKYLSRGASDRQVEYLSFHPFRAGSAPQKFLGRKAKETSKAELDRWHKVALKNGVAAKGVLVRCLSFCHLSTAGR